MSDNVENQSGPLDMLKWLIVIAMLVSVIVGNYLYEDMSVLYRALGAVGLVIAAGLIASTTHKGSTFLAFAKESRTEVRKVVWPTRQEATQTTIIVLIATAFMSLLLWGLDGIIVKVVSFITGLGI